MGEGGDSLEVGEAAAVLRRGSSSAARAGSELPPGAVGVALGAALPLGERDALGARAGREVGDSPRGLLLERRVVVALQVPHESGERVVGGEDGIDGGDDEGELAATAEEDSPPAVQVPKMS